MVIPIEIVPNSRPLKFRWKKAIDSIIGKKLIDFESTLPATIENAVAALIELAKDQEDTIKKLQAFKDWVHSYLDVLGVPKEFPDGIHTKEGCRIGDRMDWLVKSLSNQQHSTEQPEQLQPRASKKKT